MLPILRYAYPEAEIPFKPVLASYAVGVALNGFLPANIGITTATTAAAYSLGQQFIVTAWNQVFAIVLLVSAFGWSGGKQLVRDSYTQAKEKAAEQTAARKQRKAEKTAERAE